MSTAAPASGERTTSRRPLVLLLAAHFVSFAGDTMTVLAVPWFVLQTTGSAARTGIAAGSAVLPVVVASALGGTLVDRLGYRRTSLLADVASGTTITLIPLLYLAGLLRFPVLLALVFLGGLLDAPARTARAALLPEVAALAGTSIERASSALNVVERGGRALGAPAAGLLIGVVGPTHVLFVDAATFAVAVLLIAVSGVPRGAADHDRGAYFAGVRAGFAWLRRDRLLRAIVFMVTATNLIDYAFLGVLLPVYVDREFASSAPLGLLMGASTAGAALGAVGFGAVAHRMRRWPTYSISFLMVGSPRLFLLATGAPLPVLLATSFVGGLAAGTINPILHVAELERTPPALRARVMAAVTAGAYAASPAGPLVGSALVAWLGLEAALWTFGAAYLLLTLTPFVLPVWRELDHPPPAAETAQAASTATPATAQEM